MPQQIPTYLQPKGELAFWLAFTRRLPRVRGAGRIGGLVKRVYNRKSRPDTLVNVLSFKMVLDSSDSLEGELLFAPHLYDRREIACLRKHLKPGDTFVDAGANVGFYSLIASQIVGPTGTVLAVEADSVNASRLKINLQQSGVINVQLANLGLSDRSETLRLGLNTSGNRSGHSFLYDGPDAVNVECKTFNEVLTTESIRKIDLAKFDIEGFEFKVLQKFFHEAAQTSWPKHFIIESNPFFGNRGGGDPLQLLAQQGYHIVQLGEINYFASLQSTRL
jgi:FkbM family methyltransferase